MLIYLSRVCVCIKYVLETKFEATKEKKLNSYAVYIQVKLHSLNFKLEFKHFLSFYFFNLFIFNVHGIEQCKNIIYLDIICIMPKKLLLKKMCLF